MKIDWIFTREDASLPQLLKDPEVTEQINDQLGRPLQSIFIEGGPKTLSLFFEEESIDVFQCFIAPLITGGQGSRISSSNPMNNLLQNATRFRTLQVEALGQDTLIEGVSSKIAELFHDQRESKAAFS